MTDTKQPEALRLAEANELLANQAITADEKRSIIVRLFDDNAKELRRLHDENETLKKCLFQMQNAAIELAKPEQKIIGWINGEPQYAKPEQAPIQFLANGVRYKVTHQGYYGCSIVGLPENLNGQWVALVEATDSKHLNSIPPQELAKPEQEPVAYRHLHEDGYEYYDAPTGIDCNKCEPLYTSPFCKKLTKPEQEPVAWLQEDRIVPELGYDCTMTREHPKELGYTPLYTAPQKYCPSENNAAYEKGFVDGMAKQMHSSVDRAVNAMAKQWVGLTDEDVVDLYCQVGDCTEWAIGGLKDAMPFAELVEAKLKEKNI